ncbi:ABC transporter permease [Kribbella solani]|uniref:Peptide/nickel transport system permease protein n=1 Tax=Kribbella solani TaxID=236067 RepID=A0A841DZ27_9ACTN|nr:ABC transporter permease [Kribbella solani]MBB5980478.1 peptide/nickel transport system permease protein [Kribbella solani]MDX2974232.1 ABC transporter permease [Kribbella solani]MDX3004364.1 ABC transporter permease [Kribbella solani]
MTVPEAGAVEALEETPARHGLLRYAATKAGGALLSIAMVIVATFFLFRLLPGDPVRALAQGRNMTPEQLDLERARLGLDKPIPEQFLHFLGQTLRFDLGDSYEYKRPVVDLIGERIGSTLLLTGTALVLAVGLGLWQGARAGWKPGSRFDKISTAISLVLWSVPTFWLGLLLLMVFAAGIGPIPGIFPTRGSSSVDKPDGFAGVLDVGEHMVLPCLTLVAVVYAQYLLVMRSSVIDEVGQDYITTARAKGLRDDEIRRKHAVPNALLPTVTLVFMRIGFVVGGAVTVEAIFSWPGLGQLFYEAIRVPDFTLMQGTFLLITVSVILMNTLADVIYHVLDPRVRSA